MGADDFRLLPRNGSLELQIVVCLSVLMRYWLLLLTIPAAWGPIDPREIVRHSVDADDRSWQLARSYTYVQRDVFRVLDNTG